MSEQKAQDLSDGEQTPTSQEEDNTTATDDKTASTSASTSASRGRSVSRSSTCKKKKSRYDTLDEKWNNKFEKLNDNINDKFEKFLSQITQKISEPQRSESAGSSSQRCPSTDRSPQRRSRSPVRSQRPHDENLPQRLVTSETLSQRQVVDSDHNESGDDDNEHDDGISIRAHESGSDLDDDIKSADEKISEKAKKCLFELFGEDAITNKSNKKAGIKLDDSQKQVLEGSWRAKNPNSITAFAEENFEAFPVDEETEKFLQVPTLDDMIETCLINKHGKKAAFTKASRTLHSQPYKMIEKLAYRGQQAAYLGIIMQMYLQQSLGTLVENLSDDVIDTDKVIKHVRDTFAMSTKCLDQLGRTGSFHHIIRRQLAMTDTALYTLEDKRDISDLPLCAEGVFGDQLTTTLKSNKEKKKTLNELLPKFENKSRKRKSEHENASAGPSSSKRTFTDKEKSESSQSNASTNSSSSFRIPKINKSSNGKYDKKGKGSGHSKRNDSFKKGQASKGGKSQ